MPGPCLVAERRRLDRRRSDLADSRAYIAPSTRPEQLTPPASPATVRPTCMRKRRPRARERRANGRVSVRGTATEAAATAQCHAAGLDPTYCMPRDELRAGGSVPPTHVAKLAATGRRAAFTTRRDPGSLWQVPCWRDDREHGSEEQTDRSRCVLES
ncbi:hypothetical protein OH76DRAFT_1490391 [Lentinus brumalis]|uniref:Uncharacterized protein n=1 Tax=Lentinus brumalis TaxID=2498619 RepID=A0A371CJ44_9APHY|nr:hypothetical protein OH76DRAFT_1490391 [Polyporus brumalis]